MTTRRIAIHDCGTCDGVGRTRDWDHDYNAHILTRCGDCDGSGMLTSCRRCFEVAPLPECEMHSGFCTSCAIELETSDQAAEYARIQRTA